MHILWMCISTCILNAHRYAHTYRYAFTFLLHSLSCTHQHSNVPSTWAKCCCPDTIFPFSIHLLWLLATVFDIVRSLATGVVVGLVRHVSIFAAGARI